MRRSSLILSGAFHVIMIVLAIVGLPFLSSKHDFVAPPPVVVDYIQIAKVTETDKVSKRPVNKKEEKKKIKKKRPPKAEQNTSKQAVVPVPKLKPELKKTKEAKSSDEVDPNKLPEKTEKKKKEVAAKAEPKKDFSSVLKNLVDFEDTDEDPSKEVPKDLEKTNIGAQAPLGMKLTMSEIDALRSQLEKCWNVPFGAKDIENMNVEIFMVINQDRSLREARIVNTHRYTSDTFFRAVADSALRAVRSPLCSPFNLPADKYDMWNRVTVTFNPRDMF